MGNSKGLVNICKLQYHFVYQTKNMINNKTYIGRHSTNNINDGYIGSGTLLKRAIKKYGKENFECVHMCYFNTYVESVEEEKFLVTKEYCNKDDNYNLVEGGENPIMYGEKNPSWKGGVPKRNQCVCGNMKTTRAVHCKSCNKKIIRIPTEMFTPESKEKAIKTKIDKGLTVKIKVDGNIFDSVLECAKKFNLHGSTIKSRCISSHFPSWEFLDKETQKTESKKYYIKVAKRHGRKKALTASKIKPLININGKIFYTYQGAAKEFNLNYETVQKRCVSLEYPTWYFYDILEKEKVTIKVEKLILKDKNRKRNK